MSKYTASTPQLLLSRRLSLLLLLLLIFTCCSAFTNTTMPEFNTDSLRADASQQQTLKLSLPPIYSEADLRQPSPITMPELEPTTETTSATEAAAGDSPTPAQSDALEATEAAEAATPAEPTVSAEAAATPTEPAPAEPATKALAVPTAYSANTGFKSYMDYRVLTNPRTGQYALQQKAYTDEQGFRIYDGCYMVALGTYYSQSVGQRFRITLEDGRSFMAITGDIKSDAHTDSLHQHRHGNIVEFIVDQRRISKTCRRMGDMSYAGFSGRILSIEKIL